MIRATPVAHKWLKVEGGFMMLEKPGLGRLLEPLSADAYAVASAATDARAAAARRETEALVDRACAAALATAPGANEGALRAHIRADVLRRTAAAEATKAHHLASRAIVGAAARTAACAEADAFVASSRLVDGLLARGFVVLDDVLDDTVARIARREAEQMGDFLKPTLQALTGTRSDRVGGCLRTTLRRKAARRSRAWRGSSGASPPQLMQKLAGLRR